MVCGCITYKGLCQDPFDILNKCHFKFVQSNQGAKICFLGTHILTTYQANTASNGSPGFRVLFETVVGQVYRLKVTSTLTVGDKAFVYIETPDGCRLVPRTYTFLNGAGSTSYQIDFTATECLTFVGILFNSFNQSYSLTTTEFKVSCVEPIDCDQVVACLCQIPVCLDEYTYEICLDFLQVHLDLLNSPASFPPGTALSIQAYRLAEGSLIGATGIPQPIGVVPVTFGQVRTAFENLDWTTVNLGLGGEFRASLSNKIEVISHVLIDSTLAPIPPFSINLPTNCTQLDECATEDPANQLLLKRPDNSLCWANICPPKIDICLTKCEAEDHVGILPDETLSDNASISIGPRGSGFLCAQKPIPGSTGGGDCRGSYAVDWQMSRDTSDDVAGGDFSAIGGGLNNQINDAAAFGPVGKLGAIGAKAAVVGGGSGNLVQALADDSNVGYSVIDGGRDNQISAEALSSTTASSAIGGGFSNLVQALGDSSTVGYSVINGGLSNRIGANALSGTAALAVIGGGQLNKIVAKNASADASQSVIAGGSGNKIYAYSSAAQSVIGGGQNNFIQSFGVRDAVHSVIGGGYANVSSGGQAIVIAGGHQNQIISFYGQTTNYNTISGGRDNKIQALGASSETKSAVIAGGRNNQITDDLVSEGGKYSVIGGGKDHKIQVPYSVISGGQYNRILGTSKYNSLNTIVGGYGNIITDSGACLILNGAFNSISGAGLSVVGGIGSGSNYDNCFVFGVGAGSTGPEQVVFNAIPKTSIPNGLNVVVRPNGILGIGEPFKIRQGTFSGIADWDVLTGVDDPFDSGTVPFHLIYTCLGFQVDVCLNIEANIYPGGIGYNILYDIPLIGANLPSAVGLANFQITSVESPGLALNMTPVGVLKTMFISNLNVNVALFLRFRLNCVNLGPIIETKRAIATYVKICYTNGTPPINPDA